MITTAKVTRTLGILGVVGFLAHATSSLATSGAYQDPVSLPASVEAAPPPDEPEPIKDLPPAPEEPGLDLTDPPTLPAGPTATPTPAPAPAPASIVPPAPPAEEPNPLPPARELTPRAATIAPPAPSAEPDRPAPRAKQAETKANEDPSDDPDAHARTFVERNRREAEGQLKALREESAQLKARLARVEAGIRRWEALADAMSRTTQEKAAIAAGDDSRVYRSRGPVQYGVPVAVPGGVVIQSQPLTRSDFVPVPQPR